MKTFVVFLLLLSTIFCYSGMYYSDGVVLGGSYLNETESDIDGDSYTTTGIDGYISYLLPGGTVELIGSYGTVSQEYEDSDYSDFNMDGQGLQLGGAFYLRSPSIITARFAGYYSTMSFSGNYIDLFESLYGDVDVSGSGTTFSAGIFAKAYASDTIDIIPFFNYNMNSVEVVVEYGYESIDETEDYNSTSFGVGFKMGNIVIQPTVSRNEDGDQSYYIMAGIKI